MRSQILTIFLSVGFMCAWWFHSFLVNFRFSPEWKWKILVWKIQYIFFKKFRWLKKLKKLFIVWNFECFSKLQLHNLVIIFFPDNPDLLETATHIVCPKCHSPTNTNVEVKNTKKTHLLAVLMCLLGWVKVVWCSPVSVKFHHIFYWLVGAAFVLGFLTQWMVNLMD